MKKKISLIAVLLILLIVFYAISIAEEKLEPFSVRNGIKFGQTLEEIWSIEYNNNLTEEQKNQYDTQRNPLITEPYNTDNGMNYYFFDTNINDFDVEVKYVCKQGQKTMERFNYTFFGNREADAYEYFRNLLTKKYGQPDYTNKDIAYTDNMPVEALNMIKRSIEEKEGYLVKSGINRVSYKYNEWIEEASDCKYVVDLVEIVYEHLKYGNDKTIFSHLYYTPIENATKNNVIDIL